MLASPARLISGLLSGFDLDSPSRLHAVVGLIFLVGWTASAIGLRLVRATGTGIAGLWLLVIQCAGLVLAGTQQIMDFVAMPDISNS